MNILVINAGSSSLKYQLMNPDTEQVLAKGLCERIGIDGVLIHKVPGKDDHRVEISMPTHSEAIKAAVDMLISPEFGVIKDLSEINAVGHRVVHGAESFARSVIFNDDVVKALEDCIPLAPLHNPANLTGYRACQEALGYDMPQVAVFDTAFHQTMPPKAFIYALPYEYYEKYKIRKYGFHGTSHQYVTDRAASLMGRPLDELKLISCHLGNGASICAVKNGKSYDTSMGFTPLDGLPMGTRSGSLDAGILELIMNRTNMNIDQMLNVLNKQSGALGISGISSDFRDIACAADEGNVRAKLALQVFNYSVKKLIGQYAAAMGGVDGIIFTAGIGENDDAMRESACEGLKFMGVELDLEANKKRGGERLISTPASKVSVYVIPTNEELVIARDTVRLVFGS